MSEAQASPSTPKSLADSDTRTFQWDVTEDAQAQDISPDLSACSRH